MHEPSLVSIIIPTHGRNQYLKEAIKSVKNQTYRNIELIVIDDASLAPEIIEDSLSGLSEIQVKHIRSEHTMGGARARNIGISLAEGKFIAFLDSDDIWHPQKLSFQLQFQHYGDVIGCANEIFFNENTLINFHQPVNSQPTLISINDITNELFGSTGHRLHMQTSTLLIASSLAKSVMFDEGLARHQDYQFLFDLSVRSQKFYYVAERLCYYRKAKNPLTKTTKWKIEYSSYFLEKYHSFFNREQLENFFVSQLFVPSIKTGSLYEWVLLAKKYKVFRCFLIYKITAFVAWRSINR